MLVSIATSERNASVCVTSAGNVLSSLDSQRWLEQYSNDKSAGKSTALVSMIKAAMAEAGIESAGVSAIALTNGPGAFTGLRVAVVAARMLCYAWNVPVVVVNSLEVSADKLCRQRQPAKGDTIWSVVDAQRRQVFAAKFVVGSDNKLISSSTQELYERQSLLAQLQLGDHVTGSGAVAFATEIESVTGIDLPDKALAACDAEAVSRLASQRIAAADFDDLFAIQPIYFRPSAAEEVRKAKEKN